MAEVLILQLERQVYNIWSMFRLCHELELLMGRRAITTLTCFDTVGFLIYVYFWKISCAYEKKSKGGQFLQIVLQIASESVDQNI